MRYYMDMRGRDELFYKIGHDSDNELLWEAVSKAEYPNKSDDSGLTCLHVAAMNYKVGAAEILLKKGADPNCVDNTGMTPLSYAIGRKKSNRVQMVQMLLDYGADLDYKRKDKTIRETIKMIQNPDLMQFVD